MLIAFVCDTEKQIRKLDLYGAVLFCMYGLITRTYSTALLNFVLIGIQIYKLRKLEGE